ncbi:MAG: hypothetical protein E4G94_01580 [ANME-2 cluster archaeon]|nr:MAG: hypothetical protein E4G94_01580 [ANME-2 cluster archaeon]
MTNKTNEFKAITKKDVDVQKDSIPYRSRELTKSDLPGVVETASLGEIKKPESSKKSIIE